MHGLKLRHFDERADLAEARRKQVVVLYGQGYRQTEIADFLGITQARVSQIMSSVERARAVKRSMLRHDPVGAAA